MFLFFQVTRCPGFTFSPLSFSSVFTSSHCDPSINLCFSLFSLSAASDESLHCKLADRTEAAESEGFRDSAKNASASEPAAKREPFLRHRGVVSKHSYSHRPNADKCEHGPWVSAAGKKARSTWGVGAVAAGKTYRPGQVTRLKAIKHAGIFIVDIS
jgi:hypothetical protein